MADSKEDKTAPDEHVNKAQRALDRAQKSQPMNAAVGALAGGVAAEAVAVGALYIKIISELRMNANKMGISILEFKTPRVAEQVKAATITNPRSINALRPYVWAMAAAPFAGAALGSWFATKRSNRAIDTKQAVLTQAQEMQWQERIATEKQAHTKEI